MKDQNDTFQHRWFEEVWNRGRADAIDEMLAPDVIGHGLVDEGGNEIRGAESFKSFYRSFRGAFPDVQVTVEDTVSEGDKIVGRCTVRATHAGEGIGLAPTNKHTEFTGMCMMRVEDGRMAECWNEFDFLTMNQQLGAVPAVGSPKDDSSREESLRIDAQFLDYITAAFRGGDADFGAKLKESENVSLVERIYRAIAGGDFDSLGDILAEDATLEIIGPPNAPFSGKYEGRNEVIETARRNFSQIEAQRPEILSIVAQGDTVVVVGRETGRFRPTGQEYELHWMHQHTFRDGKLAHVRELLDGAGVPALAEPEYEECAVEEYRTLMHGWFKSMMHRWFEEVWNEGRADAIDEMMASNAVAHGLTDDAGKTVRGRAGFKEFHRRFREAFPDVNVTVIETLAEKDKAAARCVVSGTHKGDGLGFAATDRPIEITGILIARVRGGKIVESWNNFDFLSLYRQLGAL